MDIKEKSLSLLLLFGTLLTETHSFILLIKPEVQNVELSLFLNYYYEISVLWYFKMLFDNLLFLIVFFVITQLERGFTVRFLYIAMINFGYHIFDFGSFIWNFKKDHNAYWLALTIITVWELKIIFGKEKSKLVNIRDY